MKSIQTEEIESLELILVDKDDNILRGPTVSYTQLQKMTGIIAITLKMRRQDGKRLVWRYEDVEGEKHAIEAFVKTKRKNVTPADPSAMYELLLKDTSIVLTTGDLCWVKYMKSITKEQTTIKLKSKQLSDAKS